MTNLQLLGENASDSGVSSVKIFENEQFGEIRVVGTSEEPLFCLADVCRVLEIKNVADCKSRLDQRGVVLTDTPTHNQYGAEVIQKLVYINEKNLYKVIMRSDKPQAEPFQDWVCGEVLPSIRKTGSYSVKTRGGADKPTFEDKLKAATWAAEFLNLNDVSKLAIAKCILDPLGLPTPDYVPSKGVVKPATDLLKANNIQMSAIAFNRIAVNRGVLIEKERKSSHGFKKFKNIADGWLEYGENQVNPNNPKETQPLWYENKFPELLNKLGIL